MRVTVALCGLTACAAVMLTPGCSTSRGLDGKVQRIASRKAARFLSNESNSVTDAFAPIRQDRSTVEELPLDLTNALHLATQYSRQLQAQRDRLYLSGLSTVAARRQFGPQYSGTLDYVRTTRKESDTTTEDGAIALKASQILPTGGSLSAAAREGRLQPEGGTNSPSYAVSAGMELRQPLLAGAGYNASHAELIQAERDLVYGLRAFVLARQDFALTIVREYYALLIQKAVTANTKANVEQSEFLRKRSEALFKIRRVAAVDVMRSQQQELSSRNTLSEAESALDVSTKRFLILLSLPVETGVTLTGTIPGLRHAEIDKDTCIKIALERRLDLATVKDQLEDAARRLRIARNSLLPKADVYVKAETSGTSDTASVKDRDDSLSTGFTLEIPLDKRPDREAVKKAEREEAGARRAVDETRDSIKVAINGSFSKLVALEVSVGIEAKNADLARRRLDYTLLRFKSGELSNRDVVEAQNELLNAQNSHVRAIVNYELQRLQLWRDSGLLDVAADGTLIELPWRESGAEGGDPVR